MYANRADAGRRLARSLLHLRGQDLVVLGLPRGGVPVAFEVAEALDAPLDVIVVRKLGVPSQPELAMGAVGEEGAIVVNPAVVQHAHVTEEEMAAVRRREQAVVEERATRFRAGRPRIPLAGRTALIVDDGVATGATARAACRVARSLGATRVVLGVPVGPREVEERFSEDADEVVCPERPFGFHAVGQCYRDFSQTGDAEVTALLHRRATELAATGQLEAATGQPEAAPGEPQAASGRSEAAAPEQSAVDQEVEIRTDDVGLEGRLCLPAGARGIVLFAHGSGSSRHSPRNQYVAEVLQKAGIGTLLFDLLTTAEERDRRMVFDIDLLATRLAAVTSWVREQPAARGLPVGYFGASTGAAAALAAAALGATERGAAAERGQDVERGAAAERGQDVAAVVSRGGRPDLAIPRLRDVRAPTLLIVGGRDPTVLELNQEAQRHLRCQNQIVVVPGAGHLFEEPGTLDRVAALACEWFSEHLVAAARS